MKQLFLPLLLTLCISHLAIAQVAPAAVLPTAPKIDQVEGTLTAIRSGITIKARLQFQAPDQLRIDVEQNEAALIAAQTIVAMGNETRIFDPSTKRLRRLPFNVVKEWWRGADLLNGGPANLLLAGLTSETLNQFYTVENTTSAPNNTKSIRLNARPNVGRLWVQEDVRFGGGGKGAYYAAFKRALFDRPARVDLILDAKNNGVIERREYDDAGRMLATASLSADAVSGLPKAATVVGINGQQLAQFTYDLKARLEAFPPAVFATDLAPGQIIEDLQLKPTRAYSAGQDADSKFNLGVAIAKHTEDFPAAFAVWESASRLQPQAVAPHFEAFDAAMATRRLAQAATELTALGQLLGNDHLDVVTRRAVLATTRHDLAGAQAALEVAQRAQSQHLGIMLSRADLARSRGNMAAARSLLLDILKHPALQPVSQIAAAEMLALISHTGSDTKTTEDLLTTLPRDTQWQRLARAHLNLLLGKPVAETPFENDAALASLALAYEREGQDTPARAAWQQIMKRGLPTAANTARMHLMTLNARSGTVEESLRLYGELVDRATDENTRRRVQDALIGAWRKGYRQDLLRTGLQQHVINAGATEEDWRLWLAFQETNGTDEDIASTIQGGLARFRRGAWWQSHWAEYLMDQADAQAASGAGATASAPYVRDALNAVQAAIEADPNQPFYQIQRTLILTRKATVQGVVIDSKQSVANRRAAREGLDQLQAAWKDDPDVQISIAVQHMALEPGNLDLAVQGLEKGLQAGNPGRETLSGDRHTTASSVHQTLASVLRQGKMPAEAQQQYEILLDTVRDANTELGIARNYLILLASQRTPQPQALVRLMIRLAREPWSYSAARALLDGFSIALAQRQPLVFQVATLLRDSTDPAAHLAATHLNQAVVLVTQAQIRAQAARPTVPPKAAPGASPRPPQPARPDYNQILGAATRELNSSLQSLTTIANGTDKLLAGRASALLAENALNTRKTDEAITYLKTAVASDARDIDLRLGLAAAYRLADKTNEALTARNDILAILPRSIENLRRVATLSTDLKAHQDATRYAVQAMTIAQVAPDVAVAPFQIAAYIAARSLFDAGQLPRAIEIYNNLAAPQWDLTERAAALMDLEQRYRKGGQTTEADQVKTQITALALTQQQTRAAQRILLSVG